MMARAPASRRNVLPGQGLLNAIVVICCAVEAVLQLADRGIVGPEYLRPMVYDYAAFWPGLLADWKPHYPMQPVLMFVTYGFLHGGLLHLAFNMITLLSLGQVVLRRIGPAGFVVVYFLSMIVGAWFFAALSDSSYPMVGASGALFGLAGAVLLWLWRSQPSFTASLRATWKIFAFLILYNVVMYVALSGGLAWETHLGGFVAGWIAAWFYAGRRT